MSAKGNIVLSHQQFGQEGVGATSVECKNTTATGEADVIVSDDN